MKINISNELKSEIIDFNKTHMNVSDFDHKEAIKEAEKAIMNTDWGCDATLELPSYSTKSRNPETLNLGNTKNLYVLEDEEKDIIDRSVANSIAFGPGLISSTIEEIEDAGFTWTSVHETYIFEKHVTKK